MTFEYKKEIFILRSGRVETHEESSTLKIPVQESPLTREALFNIKSGPSREEALREIRIALSKYIPLRMNVTLHTFSSKRIKIRFWTISFIYRGKNYPYFFPTVRTGSSLFLNNILNSEEAKINANSLIEVPERTETLVGGDFTFIVINQILKDKELRDKRIFPWSLKLEARFLFPPATENILILQNGFLRNDNLPLEELSLKSGYILEARQGKSRRKAKLVVKGLRNIEFREDGVVADFIWSSYEGINAGPVELFFPYEEIRLAGITQENTTFFDEEKLILFRLPSMVVRAGSYSS